ncbi:hypothetical protein [Chromobacterium haemolyticum]|uniref:hypothetical protein n=1 Tax=Chromobacterium haemolyticum TaxID=394935 RepID=UPI0011310A39|nr:hypothetical protein [Chromobacterium haemolyticum]
MLGSEKVKGFESYGNVLISTKGIYDQARGLGLNSYQCFAYAYDELEGVWKFGGEFERVAIYTAIFVLALEQEVGFLLADPFTRDVFFELSEIYSEVDLGFFERNHGFVDGLSEDMEKVKHKILSGG